MRQWLVDTNVLLDVLGADPIFGDASRRVLTDCDREGVLIINPVIYAEVAALASSPAQLEMWLPTPRYRRDDLPWEAGFLAGQAYYRYKRRGGGKRILADFLIGAHAAVMGFGLISRDEGYAKYFRLELLNPSST